MLKRALDRFYKGRYADSHMYPPEDVVMKTLLYSVKQFSDDAATAVKLVQNDKIRFKFLVRSKRNRLARLVKDGYEKSGYHLTLESG